MSEFDNQTQRPPSAPRIRARVAPHAHAAAEKRKHAAQEDLPAVREAHAKAKPDPTMVRLAAGAQAYAKWQNLKPGLRARVDVNDCMIKAGEACVSNNKISDTPFTAEAIMGGAADNLVQQAINSEEPTSHQRLEWQKALALAMAANTPRSRMPSWLQGLVDNARLSVRDPSSGTAYSDGGGRDAGSTDSGAKEGYKGYTAGAGEKFGSTSYKPPKEQAWRDEGWQDWSSPSGSREDSGSARKYSDIARNTEATSFKKPGEKLNLEKVPTFTAIKTTPAVSGSTSPADMTPEEKEAFLNKVYGEDKKPESAAAKTPVSKVNGGEGDEVAASANAEAAKAAPSAPSGQHNYSALNQRSKAGALHREALKNKEPSSAPQVALKPEAAPAPSAEPAKPPVNAMLHQRAKHHAPVPTS